MLAISGARPARLFIGPGSSRSRVASSGALILAQTEINRMAHLAGACPFRELHFRNELRFNPGSDGFVFRLFAER
jgi:hypothetical protein